MSNPRNKQMIDIDQAVAGEAYYAIVTITPAKDAPGKWDVSFCISGSKDDPEAFSPLKENDVRRLLQLYYAFAADKPEYKGEESRNLHVARVDSKARAERLACELVYILRDAGLDPMREDKGVYQPMAPEAPLPRFPKPPRPGLF
jgi:hypothetical protein